TCALPIFPLTELAVRGREHDDRTPDAAGVDLECDVERVTVVAVAVGVVGRGAPIPAEVMGVELHRAFHQSAAVLPIAGTSDQHTEKSRRASIQRVERDGAL